MQSTVAATHLLAPAQRPLPRDDSHILLKPTSLARGPVFMLQTASRKMPQRHSHSVVGRVNHDMKKRKKQLLKGAVRMSEHSISRLQSLESDEMTDFVKTQRQMILSTCEPSVRRALAPQLRPVSMADRVSPPPSGPARHVRPTSPALQSLEEAGSDRDGPSLSCLADPARPRTAADLRSSLSRAGAALLTSPSSSAGSLSPQFTAVDEWHELNSLSYARSAPKPSHKLNETGGSEFSTSIFNSTAQRMSPIRLDGNAEAAARSLQAALQVTAVMECLPPAPYVRVKHTTTAKKRQNSLQPKQHFASSLQCSPLQHPLQAGNSSSWSALEVYGTSDVV